MYWGDYHYAIVKTGTSVDYNYDPNGNLTGDINKNITSITYNLLDLPWIITTPKGTITYTYDAAGNKLKKVTLENNVSITLNGVTSSNTITTITIYIGGFIYQSKNFTPNTDVNTKYGYTETLQYMLHEEGRARIVTPQSGTSNFAFDYFIRDHLGNVRLTLTDEPQIDYYLVATLEALGNAVPSEQRFYNITTANIISTGDLGMSWYSSALNNNYQNNNGISNPPDNLTVLPSSTSTKLYKLPAKGGAMGTDHTGLGITLKVTTGDVINIYGKSVWHNSDAVTNTNYLNTALLAFLNAFTGTGAVIEGSKGIANGAILNGSTATTGPLGTWLNTGVASPEGTPKAGFNYILFDEQFKPVFIGNSSGFIPVKSAPNDVLTFSVGNAAGGNITISKSGYLYVYCSNESNQDVYFDNLQVVQTRSQLIEERHYYPGGMAMVGISSRAYGKLANTYGYQGKEMQAGEYYDGSGLEEYDFEARYYDPQLMRWHNQDPAGQFASPYLAMGNNWPNGTDPDGKYFLVDDLIAGIIGGVINLASQALSGQIHNVGQAFGYFGSGFVGGVVFEYGGPLASGFVTSTGNALVGGATFSDAAQQGIIGGISSVAGSALGSAIGPFLGKITSGFGTTASGIVSQLGTATITGGVLGGGMSALSGGSFWDGAASGALSGFSSAAVGMGAEAGANAYRMAMMEKATPNLPQIEQPKLELRTSKVEKSKTTEIIGEKFTKITEVRPSKQSPGQSRAEMIKYKNADGKTIKLVKDSYDRGNKFQHRKIKFPTSMFTQKPLD